jgi:ATP-dependent exoDNAse (exonuclease V) beta subunit
MQKENFDDLSQRVGVALSVTKAFEDDMEQVVTSDHPILSLINLARLRKVPLRKQYDLSNILYTWEEVSYIQRAYNAYKLSNMVYDYTDILENFATKGIHNCPAFTLCFMDEAQDLSPLQWDIAHGSMKEAPACTPRATMTKPSTAGQGPTWTTSSTSMARPKSSSSPIACRGPCTGSQR